MSKFPASFFCARLTLSLECSASLVACLGLMAGQVCAALSAQPSGAVNFGSVNVASSQTATVTFTFQQGGELNNAQPYLVMTQGVTGLDFTDAGGSTCASNINYGAGATCSVNVRFSPKFPGGRFGAVNLYGGAGKAFATGYVYGIGVAPQVEFLPAVQSTLPFSGGDILPDANGNLYIQGNAGILKETLNNGTYTQSTVVDYSAIGVDGALSMALDGSGNVYIADINNQRLLKETPGPGGYIQSEIITAGSPYTVGMAADGSGNLYILSYLSAHSALLKLTLSGQSYIQSTIASVPGLGDQPAGVTVDGSGNVYVYSPGRVTKETLSDGSYTQSTVAEGSDVAERVSVDANGNVYFASGHNLIKAVPSGGDYTESVLATMAGMENACVGENGNLYIADQNDGSYNILKLTVALSPSLTFAATADGSISSDSPQTVTVANIGNAPLSLPVPSSGDNPSVSSNFTLDTSEDTDCPLIPSGASEPGTLAAGASCLLPISFEPVSPASGYVSGTLGMTDNASNAASPGYATQALKLTGSVPGAPPFGNLSSPVDSVTGTNPVSQADSVLIKGWVANPVDHAPMSNVTVYIDNTSVGKPTMGYARPTVAATYGNADLDSGYQLLYPASSLSVGLHTVTVIAIDTGGNSKTFGPLSFTVAAP